MMKTKRLTAEDLAVIETQAGNVLESATLNRCGWDYDEETGAYACEASAVCEVEGPHDMRCGSYCADHGQRTRDERCTPPHRFFVNAIPGANGIDAARRLASNVPDLIAEVRALTSERDELRAIVEGRKVAPTLAEVAKHEDEGGTWLFFETKNAEGQSLHDAAPAVADREFNAYEARESQMRSSAPTFDGGLSPPTDAHARGRR